jgi:flagellar biogenesis protein FliO
MARRRPTCAAAAAARARREEFNMGFVAMFAALTFVKVFHWLVQVGGGRGAGGRKGGGAGGTGRAAGLRF